MLDYVAKLKSSKRTEIGIVKFMWPCREERTGYDAFFNYLNVRNRYGVVGNSSKTFKDFYILPLSRTSDIPKVLLPIDGPGNICSKSESVFLLNFFLSLQELRKNYIVPIYYWAL